MAPRVQNPLHPQAVTFLRYCYRFVNEDWQHLPRDESADQGFEVKFREGCVTKLGGWVISQPREMNLGAGLSTASGVLHEIDTVVQNEPVVGIVELKNRATDPTEKNDVIVFFAKILDYFCLTPALLRLRIVPVFVSSYAFEHSGLAACLGLGIHPVAPQLRPLPILIDNAKRMLVERDKGVTLSSENDGAFDDFCSHLSRMSSLLASADVNSRFDSLNESTIAVHASGGISVGELADELREMNGECARLIEVFRAVKRGPNEHIKF
jgi:hypothetical protein